MSKSQTHEDATRPCEHLRDVNEAAVPSPRTPNACEDCLKEGTQWVHLRQCMVCGHVGCCDSSPERHATRHFHETHHPVMRSIEPDDRWTWCYVHEVSGEFTPEPAAAGTKHRSKT
jgi:monovalent cation/hydrogen antiporter